MCVCVCVCLDVLALATAVVCYELTLLRYIDVSVEEYLQVQAERELHSLATVKPIRYRDDQAWY